MFRLPSRCDRGTGERGSVSLELVGSLPILLVAVLIAAQIGIAGHALWSAGTAARAGARAVLTGREPRGAATRALPPALREGVRVSGRDRVTVRVRIPRLLPVLPEAHVSGSSSLGAR